MKVFVVASLIVALQVTCVAGPLGLEMGTPLGKLQSKIKLKVDKPYELSTSTLPNGHPDFNLYRFLVTPQHGLCKATASKTTINTSIYGTELLTVFDRYYVALTSKYGDGKRFDYLRPESIWDDDKDWMMALHKKERVLAGFWTKNEVTLPDNLEVVKIQAYASDIETGLISITYEFQNTNDCIDWIKSKRDSKL